MGKITIGRNDDNSQVVNPKPVVQVERFDDSEIKKSLDELNRNQMKLERRIKLIKIFIPIALALAVVGIFT